MFLHDAAGNTMQVPASASITLTTTATGLALSTSLPFTSSRFVNLVITAAGASKMCLSATATSA